MKQYLLLFILMVLAGGLSCSKQAPPSQKPSPVLETRSAPGSPSPAPTQDLSEALDGLTSATPGNASSAGGSVSGPVSEDDLEYVIEDFKGSVSVREEGSTQAEPAEEEEVVGEGDEIITGAGSEASLTLDEDTMVNIPRDSDVKVDQLRPKPESGFLSRLELVKGRVLSEVEKLGERHSTFEVESGGVVCGVRGTAFEVQKEGGTIHTFTYHGVVEMRQGAQVQAVVADHHSAFSPQKGGFLAPRPLSQAERGHYQNWLRKKSLVQREQSRRLAVLRKLNSLPPEEKNRVLENLRNVPRRDRIRRMHEMLQKPFHPGRGGMQRARPGQGPRNRGGRPQGVPAGRNPAKIKNRKGPGSTAPKGPNRSFQRRGKPRGPGRTSSGKSSPHNPSHFQKRPVGQPGRLNHAQPQGAPKGKPVRPASGFAKATLDRQGRPGRPQKKNGKRQGEKRKDGGK